jgi:two-component system sensor histidine kinase TctE
LNAAPSRKVSLRRYLLLGILLPVAVFIVLNTVFLYRQALGAVNIAYDRTLLASAKSIGEQLSITHDARGLHLKAHFAYSVLEAFEADNRSRIYYKVTGFEGELVSGFEDLPSWQGRLPRQNIYAALVDFYDDSYRGDQVRVAVLLQPVASPAGQGMATIQVAETLELRQTLARQILIDTLWRQALLIIVIALVVSVVVQRATRPVRALSQQLRERHEGDLSPLQADNAPRELSPLITATNQVMARLAHLLEHQKRFVRDASHQLRTPLAVLKTQVQSALRGDVDTRQSLDEINRTVDRATLLANQMLALAKVEQLRQQTEPPIVDWAEVLREVSLDLSPLIADKDIDFEISTLPSLIRTHDWMLRELSRNLLHNAIHHSPAGGSLLVSLHGDSGHAVLQIRDSGAGITPELRARLFQPFSSGEVHSGSGLGLAICREITLALGGTISLDNREEQGRVLGLTATVRLPLLQNPD